MDLAVFIGMGATTSPVAYETVAISSFLFTGICIYALIT